LTILAYTNAMSLFLPIINAFNKGKVTYVVVGGLAVVLHGHARLTADVDFIIGLDATNAAKAVKIASKLGFKPRVPVNPQDFADSKKRALWIKQKGLTVFSFYNSKNPLIGIDFFVDYPMNFKDILSRSVVKQLGKIPIRICSINDLIKMKMKAGRPKDLEDARILKMIKNEKA